jgi:hypothetical protein
MHKGGHQDFSAPSSTDEKITYSKRFIARMCAYMGGE